MFQQINQGMIIQVKVIPKASRSEVVGWENAALKIRLAAAPNRGEANAELIRFLAHFLDISKSKVRLVQGETSRHKRLCLVGLSMTQLEEKIKFCFLRDKR